jgi:hypothetical protein
MDTSQNASTVNQQDRLAAEMQFQRQRMMQQQYYFQKQQNISQIMNALQQVDPFEVIKTVSQHGVYTLQLEPQERMWLSNIIFQIFNDQTNNCSVEELRNILNLLNAAAGATNRMQMMQIGRPGMGGGMMGGMPKTMGYGGYNPMMGGGMPNMMGMGMGGMPSMIGYGAGMAGQGPGFQFKTEGDTVDTEAAIAQFKHIFSNLIYQCDPVIFINYLLQESYEPNAISNETFTNTLRQLIGNSLWKAQDNILQIFYYAISYLYSTEYQKKMNGNGKQQGNQQYNVGGTVIGVGGMPNMMGMNMGMPGMMNFGGFNPMGGGMPGGMNMGMPMDFGYNPMMGGGMPNMMGMGMPGGMNMMGMSGMVPPMNGMGMPGGMNMNMGMSGMSGGIGDMGPSQGPAPMW